MTDHIRNTPEHDARVRKLFGRTRNGLPVPTCAMTTGCACSALCADEGACYVGTLKPSVLGVRDLRGHDTAEEAVNAWLDCEHIEDEVTEPAPKPSYPAAAYPDDNPKTAIGAKKPAMSAVPPVALLQMGQAMADGARKYGAFNYREKTVSATTYYDAIMRHMLAWLDGQNAAADSGVHHLAHVMACCAILIDAESVGRLNDNRPAVTGAAPLWISEHSA